MEPVWIGPVATGLLILIGGMLVAPAASRVGAEEVERRVRMHAEWRREKERPYELPAEEVFKEAFITNVDIVE